MSFIKPLFYKISKFFLDSIVGNIILVIIFINYFWQFSIVPSASMEKTLMTGDIVVVNKHTFGLKNLRIPIIEYDLFTKKNSFLIEFDKPKYGTVTVFHPPFSNAQYYVKRMVAKPGDIVFFKDKKMYIHFSKDNILEAKSILKIDEYSKYITLNGKKFFIEPYIKNIPDIQYNPDLKFIESELAKTTLSTQVNLLELEPDLQKKLQDYKIISIISEFPNNTEYVTQRVSNSTMSHSAYVIPEDNYFMVGDNRDNSKDGRFFGPVPFEDFVGEPSFILFNIQTFEFNRFFKGII